jgi:hypothetical protein
MLSDRRCLDWERGPNLITEVNIEGINDKRDVDSFPRQVASLLRVVQTGVSRDELMQKAFQLGLHPMWESKDEGVGVMHIVLDEKNWRICCTYRPERIH